MAFNFDIWKDKTQKQLRGWKKRFDLSGIKSAYYFIAASSLLPVIQAVHSGDLSAAVVLGSALGGAVGTNLLAGMLQQLKDKSDEQIAGELQSEAQKTPELNGEIDALLKKLDALGEAGHALGETDKQWFAETIQQELERLGSSVKYEAALIGEGAIAQGAGAISLGKGATYVKGDYVAPGGTKVSAPDPWEIEREKRAAALKKYLEKLRKHCQVLPLAALGGEEGMEDDLSLDDVYIDLDTTLNIRKKDLTNLRKRKKTDLAGVLTGKETPELMAGREESKDVEPLPLLDAVRATPRVVVLGDPGAGKSTFARKLLGWQAASQLGHCDPIRGITPGLLPVLIVLRELAAPLSRLRLKGLAAQAQKDAFLGLVRKYLADELKRDRTVELIPVLEQALESGQALLVLDGLDEVPQDLRKSVRQLVSALLAEYQLERLIITSRIRSYVGEAVFDNIPVFIVRGFDREKIRGFVGGWYRAQEKMGRVLEKDRQARVNDLVRAATSSDLRELSSNPMMLTSMAIIHQKEIGLPRERVRLYKLVVDVLINRWQKHKMGEGEMAPSAELREFLRDENRLLPAIERLAYEAHRAGKIKTRAADLSRKDALAILEAPEYLREIGVAGEFLDYVDQRAGLLRGEGGELDKPSSYRFPHRTFQEYLAGCYLVSDRNAAREFYRCAGEGDYWALAAQLGAEELRYNRRGLHNMLDLAYHLCPGPAPETEQEQRAALWSGNMACIAGRGEIESDTDSPEGGSRYLRHLIPAVAGLLESNLLAIERAEAGRVLGRLGDPREEVLICERMAFCHVPAGPFLFGDEKKKVNLLDEYWIGKYPVTNAQFGQFIVAGGYQNKSYWAEAIRDKVSTTDGFKGHFDLKPRIAPVEYGEPFDLPNHPVVGVSWYEALAFTRWLSENLPTINSGWSVNKSEEAFRSMINTGKCHITLPTEEQWEKGARGTDGREYPWRGDFDPEKANTLETSIRTTSAVGCFPGGQSPYGLLDASGNVFQWTLTSEGRTRVPRGGSFDLDSDIARCTSRFWVDASGRGNLSGFRVVVSPFLPS